MSGEAGLGVVLAAAGASRRLGFDKLFTPVLGKTAFQTGLAQILLSPLVRQVVIVTSFDKKELITKLLPKNPAIPIQVISGGAERQDSVRAGLAAIDPTLEYVMIQDAARPFVTPELIEKVFASAMHYGAAVCGYPVTDTLKEIQEADGLPFVAQTIDRSRIWAVQTPQIFSRQLLHDAYAAVAEAGHTVTDDTAAIEAIGHPVALVRHDDLNLKITRKSDWEIGMRQLFPLEENVTLAGELRKIVHDFSNHLTSLLGFAYLLEADVPADSPLKPSVNSLNASVQKCHEITATLQKYARSVYARYAGLQQGIENPTLEGVNVPYTETTRLPVKPEIPL